MTAGSETPEEKKVRAGKSETCRASEWQSQDRYARLRRALLTTLIDFAKHARGVRTEEKWERRKLPAPLPD